MSDRDLHKLAAEARTPADAGGLRLERHRVDDEPSAGRERGERALDHAGRARAAADEDGVRPGQILKHMGRFARDHGKRWDAEAQRVAGDARRAVVAGFDRDRAVGGIGEHPFDRDRAGARADVPQEFAAPGRERRERDRADVALGDLAVVLERLVRQAGRARQDASVAVGDDLERDGVERGDVVERESLSPAIRECARAGRPSPRRP